MRRVLFVLPLVALLVCGCSKQVEPQKEKPRLKGEGYGDGPIATPLKTMWKVDRKVKIDFPVTQALQMYKVSHDKPPQNQAEFEEMIKEQQVILPKPQAGFRYQWNVKEQKVDIVPVD